MKVTEKTFKHEGVRKDGSFKKEAGSVEVNGKVRESINGSCDMPPCKCSEGHWVAIIEKRTSEGIVKGKTIYFDNMRIFLQVRN